MRKIIERREREEVRKVKPKKELKTGNDYIDAIMELPLESKSLHDRLGEMMHAIGTWTGYNVNIRHKITPEHAFELDVAWLRGKNPAIAIEIQVSGNITEAKERLNSVIRFDELRHWLDAWSIRLIYELHISGERLRYEEKNQLELI